VEGQGEEMREKMCSSKVFLVTSRGRLSLAQSNDSVCWQLTIFCLASVLVCVSLLAS
jgi:hypothetical protein